jgi:flagellar biosynthetic protein FliS
VAINRLMDIIAELQNSLDLDRGGRIATDLGQSRTPTSSSRLFEAISRQDPHPVQEVETILTNLRGAWQQIATQPPDGVAGARS